MKVPGLPYWLCSQYGTLHLSLMCRVPNIVHIIMNVVFAPSFFVHFNQISAEMKVSGAPYEMEVSRLPYWLCSQCDTLHLSFNVSSAKHCSYSYEFCFYYAIFRAFYLNLTLENAASFFRIDTSVLVVVLSKLTSASAASLVRIDASTPVRHFSMSPRKTFRLFHKTFEFNVLR